MSFKVYTVYVLKLEQNKLYVGLFGNFSKRLAQHKTGKGSEWTKLYPVINVESKEIVTSKNKAVERERHLTLTLMKSKGLNNVRGSCWTRRSDFNPNGSVKTTVDNFTTQVLS